jgi:hypothetical protein
MERDCCQETVEKEAGYSPNVLALSRPPRAFRLYILPAAVTLRGSLICWPSE